MLDYLLFVGEILLLLLYFFLFIRLVGHKELRETSAIDFAYMILFVNVGWDMLLEPEYNMIHIFFALLVLTAVFWIIDWLAYKNKRVEKVFIGDPVVLVKNGKRNEKSIKRERISDQELESMLRQKGVFDIETVELAVLEVDGGISVKLKGDVRS